MDLKEIFSNFFKFKPFKEEDLVRLSTKVGLSDRKTYLIVTFNNFKIRKLKLVELILFQKTVAPKLDKSSLLNRCYIRFWGCNPKYDLPVTSIFPINIVSYFLNPGILFWIGSDV